MPSRGPIPGTIFYPGSYRGWLSAAKPGDVYWTQRPIYNMYLAAKTTGRKIYCSKFVGFSLRGTGKKNMEVVNLVRVTVVK